ncbi:glucose/ribitol dehydrogenase [Artemisia annua]|uniref:Glucose/ribitol dehydrogenase n=1 Tax=Artemisia annua TaxID=35608 RepID=A0A2U1MMC6_ARTAN|nr:glucose/ribitol dehydrogenase [Artemisia annua]
MEEKRCAVVTGGNKGIGFEICRQLALTGIEVILTSRNESRGVEAVEKLKSSGLSNVIFHQLDITDSSSIARLAKFIETHFRKLDILINNAAESGIIIHEEEFRAGGGFVQLTDERAELLTNVIDEPYELGEQCLHINYYGTKAVTEALIPILQLSKSPRIVNVSSTGGDLIVQLTDERAELLTNVIDEPYELGEQCLHINYYGTKAVTEALIPILQLSKSPRIVNVSSTGGDLIVLNDEKMRHELQDIEKLTEERIDEIVQSFLKDFKNAKLKENGWPLTISAYKVSKIAVNAYTRLLARRFKSIIVNCVHPGYVVTDMTSQTGYITAEDGAKGPVMAALLPDDGPSGVFFNKTNIAPFFTTDWVLN